MAKYLFTSDQRINELPQKIKSVSAFIQDGHSISEYTDKSENNNATTLRFYYNLYNGTETCMKSANDPIYGIRNFVIKFQFPNTRTEESLKDSLSEKQLFAPFRSVVTILYKMAQSNTDLVSEISLDEILYYLFCNSNVYKNPLIDYNTVIENIVKGRRYKMQLDSMIASRIEWNQYQRQSRELFKVLTYASECFKLSKGVLYFSMKSEKYLKDKDFIDQILNYSQFWYPTTPTDFERSNLEYISYMDTKNTPYQVVDINLNHAVDTNLNVEKESNNETDKILQKIYYGAPGTGKSYNINKDTKGHSVIRTTFHPDSDYSTFVGAYKPIMEEGKIVYKFVKQAFLKAYLSAWKKYVDGYKSIKPAIEPQFLVIEEINRGNCAQIFGDIFQLLDRGDNMFSCYPIDVDTDIQKAIAEAFDEEGKYNLPDGFNVDGKIENYKSNYDLTLTEDIKQGHVMLLPPNLYIWATMNTSDQSLFPMDSAFKRRWNWEFVPINYYDAHQFIVKFSDGEEMNWADIIEVINYNIMTLMHNADKQIGNRFISLPEGQTEISSDVFFNKVMFYLWSEIYKDYYEDEDSIFRYKGDNISFEDIASAENRDEIIVAILKSLKGKGDKPIVVTRSTTSTE